MYLQYLDFVLAFVVSGVLTVDFVLTFVVGGVLTIDFVLAFVVSGVLTIDIVSCIWLRARVSVTHQSSRFCEKFNFCEFNVLEKNHKI